MNFVRLGVMWEGVEREAGVYDDAYLKNVNDLINRLGDAGIYTLVDAHQDVFARSICGEGMPDFYAKEVTAGGYCINKWVDTLMKPVFDKMGFCQNMDDFGYRLDENGDPLIEDCLQKMFADYYTTRQSQVAFDALYNNKMGLRDKFVAFWDRSSAEFADNPWVVGFDPLNEPYPGNNANNLYLNIPGYFDKEKLAPMYSEIYEKY